jgi:hypothetical protein
MASATEQISSLPFGNNKGVPLPQVPTDYLGWLLRDCNLSSGLREAVAGELRARGEYTPDPPEWTPPPCRLCGVAGYRCSWYVDSLQRRHIRVSCAGCNCYLGCAPGREPFITQANGGTS